MPDITARRGQYCTIHGDTHEDEYLVCDFCNEHKFYVYQKDRYYNYGFSRRSYFACSDCHSTLFDPFKLVEVDIMQRTYRSIIEVIKDTTNKKAIDYYEAVRIAYTESEDMQKHFDNPQAINNLNKDNKVLWEFTYKTIHEGPRIKVANKNPDNLLVAWVD